MFSPLRRVSDAKRLTAAAWSVAALLIAAPAFITTGSAAAADETPYVAEPVAQPWISAGQEGVVGAQASDHSGKANDDHGRPEVVGAGADTADYSDWELEDFTVTAERPGLHADTTSVPALDASFAPQADALLRAQARTWLSWISLFVSFAAAVLVSVAVGHAYRAR